MAASRSRNLRERTRHILIAGLAALLLAALTAWTTDAQQGEAFPSFPVDQPQSIDFDVDQGSFGDLTAREQTDQLRDWLLFTAVSDVGLSTEAISQIFYDVPSIRSDYLRPVANFEFGVTRSAYIGDGRIVVLVPPAGPDERTDHLAWVADRHRKDTGEIPTTLVVFEYELNPAGPTGLLTRRQPVDTAEMFTEDAGYYETALDSVGDLDRFLTRTEDVTFAHVEGDQLVVGGRDILGHDSRALKPEHVAMIYQSETRVSSAVDGFNSRWQAEFDALNAGWQNRSYRTENERAALEQQFDAVAAELQQRRDLEWEELASSLSEVSGTGFSLDAKYDYAGLAASFAEKRDALLDEVVSSPAVGVDDVSLAANGLEHADEVPLLRLINTLMSSERRMDIELGESLRHDVDAHRYQVARYAGSVQGTEAGMTMFYTDLLAKLWTIDYLGAAPVDAVPDFATDIAVKLSPIYRKEFTDLPSVRLWFGADDLGFQAAGEGDTLLFARKGTRIYAASSNPLQPGLEVRAGAYWAAPIDWWNDHYEEIARYEPEYERLNGLMKWSLIIGWLEESGRSDLLGFLDNAPVERDRWFADWVRSRPDLRFQQWAEIGFFPRGYQGASTEALPVLISEPFSVFGGDIWTLRGGVSLADERTFADRPSLPADGNVLLLRSDLDYAQAPAGTGGELYTRDDVRYAFEAEATGAAVVTTEVQQSDVTLRGPFGEFANAGIRRTVRYQDGTLGIGTSIDDVNLGNLTIDRTGRGFAVGWRSRDVELGEALARRVSGSADPLGTLLADPDVATVITLPSEPGHVWVKMVSAALWLELAPEGAGTDGPDRGWQARVAAQTGDAVSYQLAWIDESSLEGTLAGLEYERRERG